MICTYVTTGCLIISTLTTDYFLFAGNNFDTLYAVLRKLNDSPEKEIISLLWSVFSFCNSTVLLLWRGHIGSPHTGYLCAQLIHLCAQLRHCVFPWLTSRGLRNIIFEGLQWAVEWSVFLVSPPLFLCMAEEGFYQTLRACPDLQPTDCHLG